MAGHSKWANIKRQKARVDAKKASVFTKIAREIIVAARSSPDPQGNFQLRTAIQKAKAVGIPLENIERAIAKGSGKLDNDKPYEEIRYEGYGPGGIAILIEALTDNRNRTAADIRAAFNKSGGQLGETGCVGWMFNQTGIIILSNPPTEEELIETCLEVNVNSYQFIQDQDTTQVEIYTPISELETVETTLKAKKYHILEVTTRWIPQNTITITDLDQAKSLIKLIDTLEDNDDIQTVASNYDISDDLINQIFS